ncbi:GNAT family N-acetyltransferase [Aureimonas sp. Leaf324]|uniref:GNAT family N-acetyltransferase n=1 Tax=Aureimonas sp. Leaf324 TaxID=1736336 RepID=UPI0006FE43AA|nr:GNAT family N-acetyltransferase [Aureimonas sp. Leaf324]KQQ84205.1 GNAT family acetyltransferase [Aureimonas sp. Leaf324]
MPSLPTFHTARLMLKQRTLDDLQACLVMDRDPDVTRFIPGPWADPIRHEAFVRERITANFGRGFGYWSVFSQENPDRFLGWILLIPRDGAGPEIEIGWRFKRDVWGKGFATEAAKPVLEYALETLDLDRIVADIDPDNSGSIRVALKIGMADEGLHEHDGAPWRSFVMQRRTL